MSRTKTSNRSGRRRRLLRVAAEAHGVGGSPCAASWLRARQETGLKAGVGIPLMPAPDQSQGWSTVPLGNYSATRWLLAILSEGAPLSSVVNIGMHSCKVTLLSWAAKYGLALQTRKLLGYHTSSQDETAILYSRDAMAAPLRELSRLIDAVRSGAFVPDQGRSGTFHSGTLPLESAVLSDSTASGLSEDSNASEAVRQVADLHPLRVPPTWDSLPLYQHRERGTFHVLRPSHEPPTLVCGRPVSGAFSACPVRPNFISPRCMVCTASVR